jgi:hypothetical protein
MARRAEATQLPNRVVAIDPTNPATWPRDTPVVRCGTARGVAELAERLARDGTWSVFTGPGIDFIDLARSCPNNRIRRTTVGAILTAGAWLRASVGPPNHYDLGGLTPARFDAILGEPEPNPVAVEDRWTP